MKSRECEFKGKVNEEAGTTDCNLPLPPTYCTVKNHKKCQVRIYAIENMNQRGRTR